MFKNLIFKKVDFILFANKEKIHIKKNKKIYFTTNISVHI